MFSGRNHSSPAQIKVGLKAELSPTKSNATKNLNFPDYPADSIFNQFQEGDLVFGLITPRDEVNVKLQAKGFTHTFTNSLNHPVVQMVVEGAKQFEIDNLSVPCRRYFHFLIKFRQYLMTIPGRNIPRMPDQPILGAAFRRACKLLLITRDPERKSRAHFITKDINWQRIFNKKNENNERDLSVTGSELRAAFRDFQRFGKNPNIFFYDENNRAQNFPIDKLKQNCDDQIDNRPTKKRK